MDLTVAALVTKALGVDAEKANELHEQAELWIALLAVAVIELRQINERSPAGARSEAERDRGEAFLVAVSAGWGGSSFAGSELLEWAEASQLPTRRAVLVAARALVRGDLTAQRLGLALARLAERPDGAGYVLRRDGSTGGSVRWRVEAPEVD